MTRRFRQLLQATPIHFCCLVSALCPALCLAQSWPEAVRISLAQYPSISAARFKTEAAQADVTRAKAAHWPQLSWSGNYAKYQHNVLPNRWFQTPNLSLNLWSGGRIQSDVERTEALTQASLRQQQITRDDVALMSTEGYLQWAHQKTLVALAEENLKQHEKILNDFEQIAQIDTGRRIDLDQARVRHDNARLILLKNHTELAAAVERVSRMVLAPAPDAPSGLEFDLPMASDDLLQARQTLNDQHPVLADLLAQRDAALASVRYAKAQSAPTVNLSHAKSNSLGPDNNRFVTQLQLNLPLLDGGSTRGAVGAALARVQVLDAQLQETRLVLSEQLTTAWTDWVSATIRAEMGQSQTLTAQALATGYEQQFRVGRRSLLDLLNIQSDLYTYQSNAATAWHESRTAQARILATLGQLADAFTPSPATPSTPK